MATLKEIAEKAGVSVMTVSNVINKNYARVSKETAERIQRIIEQCNYEPNFFARSLSAQKSNIVAVMLPVWGTNRGNILADPYNQEMVGLLEANLNQAGYYMMLRSYHTKDEAISFFRNWNVDGAVMLYPNFDDQDLASVLEVGVPIVFLDRYFENANTLTVDLNDYKCGYIAAKHLMQFGHTQLGFAGPPDEHSIVIKERKTGFEDALKEHGLKLLEQNIYLSNTSYEAGIQTGKKLANQWEKRSTGVFATEDSLAIGIIEGLRRNGVMVPEDVSVIGCDNWFAAKFCEPKLTTVAQDFSVKADSVISLLVEAMKTKRLCKKRITLDVELVIRNSVSRCRKDKDSATLPDETKKP